MGRNYIIYFSKTLKLFFLFVVIGVLTVYKQKTLVALVKLIIWVLSGAKWLYYIKKNKYQKYFRTSVISFGVCWGVLAVSLLLESKVNTLLFMFLFAVVWVVALVWGFRAGGHFLTVINRYEPQVMRTYHTSKDYKNKVRNLEKELQRIKENAPEEVVEAIVRRELIKTIAYFHMEMIVLTILALWPSLID